LGFEGDRADPYHITECRGRFRGSLWVGSSGLKWLLKEMDGMMKPGSHLEGFFRFFRDGYRILELSCLKNRGGRFIELRDYHSGSQQGNLRIPEGKGGTGWARFDRELRRFFLGENTMAFGDRNEAVGISKSRNQRDLYRETRNPGKAVMDTSKILPRSKPSVTPEIWTSMPRVELSRVEPRPTHLSVFKWNPAGKTICISIQEGGRREVQWVGLPSSSGPKINGFRTKANNNVEQVVLEAQVEKNLELAQLHVSVGHEPIQVEAQLSLKPTSIQVTFEGPLEESVLEETELKNPVMLGECSRSFSDWVFDHTTHMESETSTPINAIQEPVSPAPCLSSGDMVQDHQLAILEDSISEDPASPLSCSPLNSVVPTAPPPLCLSYEEAMNNPSKWVSQQMNFFRKHVRVSISGHEPECLALLTRIDKDRQHLQPLHTPRKSVTKGLRELRNLSSSINYEGKQLSCC
jgi:hypothetical protein